MFLMLRWVCLLLVWPGCVFGQDVFVVDGKTYEINGGAAYEIDGESRRFVIQLYDPEHVARSYVMHDGLRYRVHPQTGEHHATMRQFEEDFEVASLHDLVGPGLGWTGFTLQSPAAPTLSDYVQLRHDILGMQADCIDNCLTTGASAQPGARALIATAVAPRSGAVSKAALETGLLDARQGNVIRFSGQFRIAEGMPVSIVDFEASYIYQGPGMRIMLDGDGTPWVELKWGEKPAWYPASPVTVPYDQWFSMTLEVLLDRHEGVVRLWLDDVLIVSGTGQTLPLADAVIDRMEVGVTAATGAQTQVLVDAITLKVVSSP
jgi:hypothetical protein